MRRALMMAATLTALPLAGRAQEAPCPPAAAEATERGWRLYRADSIAAAARAFAEGDAGCPRNLDAKVGLGFVALRQDDAARADSIFTAVTAIAPTSADAWDGLATAAHRRGDLPRAIAAARRTLEIDASYRSARALLDRLAPDWDCPVTAPARRRRDTLQMPLRVCGERFELRVGGTWQPFFVKGVNMGLALPGRFPAEFPTDSALFAGWFDRIAAMHANTMRVYTILPPAFYRALRGYNLTHADRPLYLIHGVWIELPPAHDYDDTAFTAEFRADIRRVVDLLHGAAELPPRPGHASGRYDADVSPWVIAYVTGREWEPYSIILYNRKAPQVRSHRGRFLTIERAPSADVWMVAQCDYLLAYEFDTYHAIRPIAYTNWPTTDPLTHPTETSYEQQMAFRGLKYVVADTTEPPHEEDGPSLDPSLVRVTAANPAGWFASYHVYPYYPDFMLYDPGYRQARSSFGPSNYIGYLRDLKRHHAGIPLLIAEFGVPTSRGMAHLQPQGWHHGGLDEREAAAINARLAAEIRESGAAGAIFFAWIDEWFKKNWFSADFEHPPERARLWHNAMSPEQFYGILALEPGADQQRVPRLGGDPAPWTALPVLQAGPLLGPDTTRLRVGHDEGYVYLALETPALRGRPFPWDRVDLQVGIDTWRPERGQQVLPRSGLRSQAAFEFLLELHAPDDAQLRITPDYNPYVPHRLVEGGDFFGEHFRRPLLSLRRWDGVFDTLYALTNRPRFTIEGALIRGQGINLGRLRYGRWQDHTLSDWWYDETTGTIQVRLPWNLLNVSDPSSRRVLYESDEALALDPRDEPPYSELTGVPTDGFRFAVAAITPGPDLLGTIPRLNEYGQWPRDAFRTWTWPPWEEPTYHERTKPVYEALRALWAAP